MLVEFEAALRARMRQFEGVNARLQEVYRGNDLAALRQARRGARGEGAARARGAGGGGAARWRYGRASGCADAPTPARSPSTTHAPPRHTIHMHRPARCASSP